MSRTSTAVCEWRRAVRTAGRERIPSDDERLPPPRAIRQPSARELEQRRDGIRGALDRPDEGRARPKRGGQKERQQGIDHLARRVGEEAHRREGDDVAAELHVNPSSRESHPPPRQRCRQGTVRQQLVVKCPQGEHRAARFAGIIAQPQDLAATDGIAELIGGKRGVANGLGVRRAFVERELIAQNGSGAIDRHPLGVERDVENHSQRAPEEVVYLKDSARGITDESLLDMRFSQ